MSKQKYSSIAIGYGDNDRTDLWCKIVEAGPGEDQEAVHFKVINGSWYGVMKGGMLTVKATSETYPAKLLWCGSLSDVSRYDYDACIKKVDEILEQQEAVLLENHTEKKDSSSALIFGGLAVMAVTAAITSAAKAKAHKERQHEKHQRR